MTDTERLVALIISTGVISIPPSARLWSRICVAAGRIRGRQRNAVRIMQRIIAAADGTGPRQLEWASLFILAADLEREECEPRPAGQRAGRRKVGLAMRSLIARLVAERVGAMGRAAAVSEVAAITCRSARTVEAYYDAENRRLRDLDVRARLAQMRQRVEQLGR
jgi:hypothetical protein